MESIYCFFFKLKCTEIYFFFYFKPKLFTFRRKKIYILKETHSTIVQSMCFVLCVVFFVLFFCTAHSYYRCYIVTEVSIYVYYLGVNNIDEESLLIICILFFFMSFTNVKSTINQLNTYGPFGHNLIAL